MRISDWSSDVCSSDLIGQENGDCRMRFDAQSCRFGDIDGQFYWCTHPDILLPKLQFNARPSGAWLNARDRHLSIGRQARHHRLYGATYPNNMRAASSQSCGATAPSKPRREIGRASFRERVWQYVELSGGAVVLK